MGTRLRQRMISGCLVALAPLVCASATTIAGPAAVASAVPAAAGFGCATVHRDLQVATAHLDQANRSLAVGRYPARSKGDGTWITTGPEEWTSGFLPGALWLAYEQSGNPYWRDWARAREAGIESQEYNTGTHDIGFMIYDSFGNGYRLTADQREHDVTLTAAGSLSRRFNPAVGSIRSWGAITDPGFTVIIDNMMNIELLFWGAAQGGDPTWAQMAVRHAFTSARDLVRPDGSTFQAAEYDQDSGAVVRRHTVQGYNDNSTWSRGQAWAIHGFTTTYGYTHNQHFLDTARAAADYFVHHLPADGVPYWDFGLPRTVGQPRDSSAAAIAASGLIELSALDPDRTRSTRYLHAAQAILTALSTPTYLADRTDRGAILLHGTQNKPAGNADTGLIFGDYYFLEALLRYAKLPDSGC